MPLCVYNGSDGINANKKIYDKINTLWNVNYGKKGHKCVTVYRDYKQHNHKTIRYDAQKPAVKMFISDYDITCNAFVKLVSLSVLIKSVPDIVNILKCSHFLMANCIKQLEILLLYENYIVS